jgi:hypothetical protein
MNEKQKAALKWAIDNASQLESFHRCESAYYKNLPRSKTDLEKAEIYNDIKVTLLSIIYPNENQTTKEAK